MLKRLVPIFTLLLLASCGSQPADTLATPTAAALTGSDPSGPSDIQIAVASDGFVVGAPRVPFILFSGPERVADARSVTLTAYDLSEGTPVPGWTGEAANYSDYAVPYWVAYPELPHAGAWGLGADITLADGRTVPAQFAIQVLNSTPMPDVNSRPPASENRTLATEPDIALLTSDPTPEPALYQLTVAEALASGRPTVVTFATPAFCQTDICAPVVDSVEAVYHEYGDAANFIHVEIYQTFDPLVLADEVAEWGLGTEPWTFVLDDDGQVAARLGGPLSPRELTLALEPLLAAP